MLDIDNFMKNNFLTTNQQEAASALFKSGYIMGNIIRELIDQPC